VVAENEEQRLEQRGPAVGEEESVSIKAEKSEDIDAVYDGIARSPDQTRRSDPLLLKGNKTISQRKEWRGTVTDQGRLVVKARTPLGDVNATRGNQEFGRERS
jgi:hypothetical protein